MAVWGRFIRATLGVIASMTLVLAAWAYMQLREVSRGWRVASGT